MTPTIDADRLWQSLMDIAEIGPTPEGGSCRLALTPEDAASARAVFLRRWCQPLGLKYEQDAIGNITSPAPRLAVDPAAPAVKSVRQPSRYGAPTGGRFDGVAGVLAGLEVMRALTDAGVTTRAPLELVNWTNEEGSRFRPAMMGSRVAGASFRLADALAITDDDGISVAQALADTGQAGSASNPPAPRDWHSWLELHIEQGPVMEATGADIGIVTATMHARYFQLVVTGEPSHVGPTEMNRRHDSLAAAAEVILAVERIGLGAEPGGRASASWIENIPNARGNVSHITRLHCDVRHNAAQAAIAMEATLRGVLTEIAARRGVRVDIDPYTTFGPIVFDPEGWVPCCAPRRRRDN